MHDIFIQFIVSHNGLTLLYLNFNFDELIIKISKFYIAIPLILFSFFMLMVITIRFIIFPISSLVDNDKSSQPTCEITILLFQLLKSISLVKHIHTMKTKDKINILNRINKIANLIKSYPSEFGNKTMINTFYKSSYLFENLNNSFIMPKNDSLEYCKKEVINYCNCFLSGDLDSLPRDENAPQYKLSTQKSKFISLISIIIYLLIPIIIYFIVDYFVKIELNEFKQSLLKIAYVIWSIIGITSNHTIFNTETKELLKDIINTFIKK